MLSEIKSFAQVLTDEQKLEILTNFLNDARVKELGVKNALTKEEEGEMLQKSCEAIAMLPNEVGVIKYPSSNEFAITGEADQVTIWSLEQIREYVDILQITVAFGSVNKHLKQS